MIMDFIKCGRIHRATQDDQWDAQRRTPLWDDDVRYFNIKQQSLFLRSTFSFIPQIPFGISQTFSSSTCFDQFDLLWVLIEIITTPMIVRVSFSRQQVFS